MSADTPAVFDHLRPTDTEHYPPGIYRVVGTSEDGITLLRVANADGRRAHTGEVVTVSKHTLKFEAAENPDGNRSVGAIFSSIGTAYWSLRTFVGSLAAHPLASVVALAFLLTGQFGEGVLPLSDATLAGLVLVGTFGLVYVGSGRL